MACFFYIWKDWRQRAKLHPAPIVVDPMAKWNPPTTTCLCLSFASFDFEIPQVPDSDNLQMAFWDTAMFHGMCAPKAKTSEDSNPRAVLTFQFFLPLSVC
jgi:hypothetical protein